MAPNRRLTANEVLYYAFDVSSLAAFLIARGSKGVTAIIIREHLDREGMVRELQRRFPKASLVRSESILVAERESVRGFIDDPRQNLAFPLDIRGTDFQRRVYTAVLSIPFGATTTFASIARTIGAPTSVRAVGSACTRNPLEFAIPCHRVLRTDGRWAGGGAWGDYRQEQLVKRERAALGDSSAR